MSSKSNLSFDAAIRSLATRFALPGLAWVGLFFLLPGFLLVVASFAHRSPDALLAWWPPTVQAYNDVFRAAHWNYVLNSFLFACLTTVVCAVVAYPVAIFMSRQTPRKKMLFLLLAVLPLFTNYLVRLFALSLWLRASGPVVALLQRMGLSIDIVGTPLGVVLGMTYVSWPLMLLPLFVSVDKMDRHLLEAASDLGASRWQVFYRIVLPLTRKGLFTGAVFVLVPNLGELLVPRVLGGGKIPVLGMLIEDQFLGRIQTNWPLGAALTVMLTLVVLPLVWWENHAASKEG